MQPVKDFVAKYFEFMFVLAVLAICSVITYYVDHKIAFLNFYYLPVIMASFYLGKHFAMQGTIFIITTIVFFVVVWPNEFIPRGTTTDMYINVVLWASFLVVTGAVVAKLQESFQGELVRTRFLVQELEKNRKELAEKNAALETHSEDLEEKVAERTQALEAAKNTVENLKRKVENTLYSTMDASVAKLMIEGKLRNEKKSVTVMFSDIIGFTSYSEDHRPEQVIRELNAYLGEMEPIILAYRGHIDKYLGDGIMVEFGAPIEVTHHHTMAVVSALMMQKKLKSMNNSWQMRIGLCSGQTIMGIVGSKRSSYTTIGDVVNIAARIEKMCKPGSVFIDEETKEGVRDFVDFKEVASAVFTDGVSKGDMDEVQNLFDKAESLEIGPEKVKVLHKLGSLLLKIGDTEEALKCLEKAMSYDSENNEIKIAFAEATLKRSEALKLKVKGRKKTIKVYEVLGIKDIFKDDARFPLEFVEKYRHFETCITIPEEVILPIEALEGSIGHSKGVAILAFAICDTLGLPEYQKKDITNAAYVADIGKEIVPHHLLTRNASLSDDEYLQLQDHALEGARIVKLMGYDNETMIEGIRHSHETYDGKGYPDGLEGQDIPIASRIIAVADAYDAMVSWRNYRDRWDIYSAIAEIEKSAARGVFDPQIVSILKELLIPSGMEEAS